MSTSQARSLTPHQQRALSADQLKALIAAGASDLTGQVPTTPPYRTAASSEIPANFLTFEEIL